MTTPRPRRRTTRARTTRPRTATRRRSYSRRSLGSTLGGAVGVAAIAWFTQESWPVRIAIIVVAIIGALAWFLWTKRAAIAADMAAQAEAGAESSEGAVESPAEPPA